MKVVKPNKLSVLTRCFEHERQFLFGVSVLVFVPLAEELVLLSEQALWTFAAERMGPQGILEEGIPKARAEFLVHGSCFAPGGVPHPRVPVSVKVGECERALSVTGDRYFTPRGSPSEPQPFTQMPLHWSHAYGGPKYERNPLGRGHGKSEYMGQQVQLLPNIEDPAALVHAPGDRPEPAGFGPLDIGWPQRQKLAGTYDQRWLEEHFPGLAPDIDWQMFSRAQPAQRIDGFWQGGERYRLHNLHPERPVIEGQLPRLAARAFIGRRQGEGPEAAVGLMPVEQSLRTVWLFPDAERAVLVFQGSILVERDDASDVDFLVIAAEHQDSPRPHEHYAAALQARLDPDHGAQATLVEHDLLPEGTADAVDDLQAAERDIFSSERKLEHNMHRRAQREYERAVLDLKDKGLDPEALGLEPPAPPAPTPSVDELPQLVEQLKADADVKREDAEADLEKRREQLGQKLETMGFSQEERARLLQEDQPGPTGPPTFTAEGQRQGVRALVQQVRETGSPTEQLEAMLEDPEQYERWVQAEAQLRDNYRKGAHLQDPAPRMEPARSEEAHAFLRAALEAGEDLSRRDLTGADLSGMDLRNANLAGALLESACLDGADLRGADLRGAVVAHGSLRKARLDDANLAGANLGKCGLQEAVLLGADLTGAELTEADLTRASLRGATLAEATLTKATLSHADAREVQTDQLVFAEVEAAGIQLGGAQLPKAVFLRLDLRGADLTGANLAGATFLGCDLREVSLAGAALDGARFVEACQLDGARLIKASLGMTNLRGSSLRGSDFTEAMLDGADLSECTLVEATLYRAVARGTRFEKADLSDASLVSANLMEASFLSATIVGADLRGSNLFAADMARVRTDEHVLLEGANLTRVRIHPRHEETPA